MPSRAPFRYFGPLVLVALGAAALLAFLLGNGYSELQTKAETDARNIVNILETRLDASLRRFKPTSRNWPPKRPRNP